MEVTFRRDYSIRYDEVDFCNRLTPVAILNCCQDAAARHTRRLGVSLADLNSLGLTWVLSRFRLLLDRYPPPGEGIAVSTWPSAREGYFTCREFLLADGDGAVWGRATSSWAAIDLESRRPVRLEERLPHYPLRPERAVDDPFATLPRPDAVDTELSFPVMRRDLDQNRHVNNAVYLQWGLEAIPDTLYSSALPLDMALNCRAEAFAGETVRSRIQIREAGAGAGTACVHQICAGDGRELARLLTVWSPGSGGTCPS